MRTIDVCLIPRQRVWFQFEGQNTNEQTDGSPVRVVQTPYNMGFSLLWQPNYAEKCNKNAAIQQLTRLKVSKRHG